MPGPEGSGGGAPTNPNTRGADNRPAYLLGADLNTTVSYLANFINGTTSSEGQADNEAQAFLQTAEKFDVDFRAQYEKEGSKTTPKKRKELATWINEDQSAEGRHSLEAAIEAIGTLWNQIQRQGVPGQDKPHILEDTRGELYSLYQSGQSSESDGFHKIAAIPGFAHDIGRIGEERILNHTVGGEMGKKHAMISGMILWNLLRYIPNLNDDVRNQMVYAALAHQDWRPEPGSPRDHFTNKEPTSQEVRAIERSGLVGPHAVSRMIAYDVGANPAKSLDFATKVNEERKTHLDSSGNTDLTHHIEFYMRNLDPVDVEGKPQAANAEFNKRVDVYKSISGAFLWLSSTDEIRQQIFAPELARDNGETLDEKALTDNKKKPLSKELWDMIMTRVRAAEGDEGLKKIIENIALQDLAVAVAKIPEGPLKESAENKIKEKIGAITDKNAQARLALGLAFVSKSFDEITQQTELPAIQALLADKTKFPEHSVERALATFYAKALEEQAPKGEKPKKKGNDQGEQGQADGQRQREGGRRRGRRG